MLTGLQLSNVSPFAWGPKTWDFSHGNGCFQVTVPAITRALFPQNNSQAYGERGQSSAAYGHHEDHRLRKTFGVSEGSEGAQTNARTCLPSVLRHERWHDSKCVHSCIDFTLLVFALCQKKRTDEANLSPCSALHCSLAVIMPPRLGVFESLGQAGQAALETKQNPAGDAEAENNPTFFCVPTDIMRSEGNASR